MELFEDGSTLEHELQKGPSGIALVVTDNSMPRVSGLEIIQRYAKASEGVPFIMISDQHLKTEAIKYGAAAFIEKPPRLKDFRDTILEVLNLDKKPTPSLQ